MQTLKSVEKKLDAVPLKISFNSSLSTCWNGGCNAKEFKLNAPEVLAAIITYAFDKRRFNTAAPGFKSNINLSGSDNGDLFNVTYESNGGDVTDDDFISAL